MTDNKRALEHIRYVAQTIGQEVEKKGTAGQKEHGGNIDRKNVLPALLEECWDLPFYAVCLRDSLGSVEERLKFVEHELGIAVKESAEWQDSYKRILVPLNLDRLTRLLNAVTEALNILTIGNPEGLPEEER